MYFSRNGTPLSPNIGIFIRLSNSALSPQLKMSCYFFLYSEITIPEGPLTRSWRDLFVVCWLYLLSFRSSLDTLTKSIRAVQIYYYIFPSYQNPSPGIINIKLQLIHLKRQVGFIPLEIKIFKNREILWRFDNSCSVIFSSFRFIGV